MCALTGVTTPQWDYGENNNIYIEESITICTFFFFGGGEAITYNKGTI
jgi:hypothetical protein